MALDGLFRGLRQLGHDAVSRSLGLRTGFHTFDRWLYNAGVRARPPRADVVVGVDLDGFLWARRRGTSPAGVGQTYVVALKGIKIGRAHVNSSHIQKSRMPSSA